MKTVKFQVGNIVKDSQLGLAMEILGMEADNCDASRTMYVGKQNGRVELWDCITIDKHYNL